MTRQTTKELKPDPARPTDADIASEINGGARQVSDGAIPSTSYAESPTGDENLPENDVFRGDGSFTSQAAVASFSREFNYEEWLPEFDSNEIISDHLDFYEQAEEMKKMKEKLEEEFHEKKKVRFAENDDQNVDEEHKDHDEWLSVYDKSEMMCGSDYQDLSSDDRLSNTSDCTEDNVRAMEKYVAQDDESNGIKTEQKDVVGTVNGPAPKTDMVPQEEGFIPSGSGSGSSTSSSSVFEEPIEAEDEDLVARKRTEEWVERAPEDVQSVPSPTVDFDESSESDNPETKEKIIVPKPVSVPLLRDKYDSSSSTDCTENAELEIEEENRLETPQYDNLYDDSSTDDNDEKKTAKVEDADTNGKNRGDTFDPSSNSSDEAAESVEQTEQAKERTDETKEKFSSSSAEEEIEKRSKEIGEEEVNEEEAERQRSMKVREDFLQSAGRMRFRGQTTLIKVEKKSEASDAKTTDSFSEQQSGAVTESIDSPTQEKSRQVEIKADVPEVQKSDTLPHSSTTETSVGLQVPASTLSLSVTGESWRQDLTEEFNRIMDEEKEQVNITDRLNPRPPEKTPSELIKEKMSQKVDSELERTRDSETTEDKSVETGVSKKRRSRNRSRDSSSSEDENFVILPQRPTGGFPIDEKRKQPPVKKESDDEADVMKEMILQRAKVELNSPSPRDAEVKAQLVHEAADHVLKELKSLKAHPTGDDNHSDENWEASKHSDTTPSESGSEAKDPHADWASDADQNEQESFAGVQASESIGIDSRGEPTEDPEPIRHQPEPDLMERLNHLLGQTIEEIKSADSMLEQHKQRMEKAGEAYEHRNHEETADHQETGDEIRNRGFFDTALEVSGPEHEEDTVHAEEEESRPDESKHGCGYETDTEDDPEFTPGRNDYSFSDSEHDISARKERERTESVGKNEPEPATENDRDADRYETMENFDSTTDSTSSSDSEEDKGMDAGNDRGEDDREYAPDEVKRANMSPATSETSSDYSSSAWSEDENEEREKDVSEEKQDDFDKLNDTEFDVNAVSRSWMDAVAVEEKVIVLPDPGEPVDEPKFRNAGSSSDHITQPMKPKPPPKRPSSATQNRSNTGPRKIRPMSAQASRPLQQIPLTQYRFDFGNTSELSRPSRKRVSGRLYKFEPVDNDSRLRQKFDELLEIVKGDGMPIVVGPPTRTGKFSPRIHKSPRERSRSSESESEGRRRSPRHKDTKKKDKETVNIDELNKELDVKYRQLEDLMAKVGNDKGQSHRLIQNQVHQARLLIQKNKMKGDLKSKMEGYQYNLPPRPYANGQAIPARDDPRSRSFSPTDHNLRNTDNPMVRDWLKHKERCLRIQRAEERVKRKEEKKKEKSEIGEKEEKMKVSVEKVDEWMKRKRKENRRLLKFRNNKENFVNIARPQSARPEVMMSTTSLEFKRPASANLQRSSSDVQRRPRSSKQKRHEEEPTPSQSSTDKRRISYEQWLQTKRKEDEARKQDEKMQLEDLRRTYQDNELDKMIPNLARNRIRVIQSNKKRVDSGLKKTDDDANSYPRPRTSTGTKGVKMYKWRPASAQPTTSDEHKGNKYQLIRPTDYTPSPYKLSTDAQESSSTHRMNSVRPSSAKNRLKYTEHIWTNFSDNVWKQVNEQNDRPSHERPEPMGQAEPRDTVDHAGFNIEGLGTVKPLGSVEKSESVKSRTETKSEPIVVKNVNSVKPEHVIVHEPVKTEPKVEKTKGFLETLTTSKSEESSAVKIEETKPKQSESDRRVNEKKVTIMNEKAEIEPVPVARSASPLSTPTELKPSVATSDLTENLLRPDPPSPPTETVILTEDGEFKGTDSPRRSSILKLPDAPKKKKKSVTFGDVTMSDGGERSTSSDSDVDRVPVTAYRGVRHVELASQLNHNDNFFITDMTDVS